MTPPNRKRAVVERRKIVDYLLSPTHPEGRAKQGFFGGLGYSAKDWKRLAEDLRRHLRVQRVVRREAGAYGVKMVIRGSLRGPSGRTADIVSVWLIRSGEDFPRLVTAYPGDRT